MNYKKFAMPILISLIYMLSFVQYAGACLAANGIWINCTVITGGTSPINNLINTVKAANWQPFYFLYIAIYISIAAFLLRQDRSFTRFNAITFIGMIVGLVFAQYGLIGQTGVTIAVSLFALTLIASIFWGR